MIEFKVTGDIPADIQPYFDALQNYCILLEVQKWRRSLYKGCEMKENWTSDEIISKLDELLEKFRDD